MSLIGDVAAFCFAIFFSILISESRAQLCKPLYTLRCLCARLLGFDAWNVASQASVMAEVNFITTISMSVHCLTLWHIVLSFIVKSFSGTWQSNFSVRRCSGILLKVPHLSGFM